MMKRKTVFFILGIFAFLVAILALNASVLFFRGKPPGYHSGVVVATSTEGFVLRDGRNAERSVSVSPGVQILQGRTLVETVKLGNRVIVTGPLDSQGTVEARIIRILEGKSSPGK